jgi:hypothetical protein
MLVDTMATYSALIQPVIDRVPIEAGEIIPVMTATGVVYVLINN